MNSDESGQSDNDSVLLPHGGYGKLRSYKVAQAVYDATVVFCRRFHADDRRMTDQMVQAARSGVRNISEGSGMAVTSRKSEMRLTNVARASLSDELLRDFESFLVQRGLRVWPKDSREAKAMRTRLAQDSAMNLPPAPTAANSWSNAPRDKAARPASHSGAVRAIRPAKAHSQFRHDSHASNMPTVMKPSDKRRSSQPVVPRVSLNETSTNA